MARSASAPLVGRKVLLPFIVTYQCGNLAVWKFGLGVNRNSWNCTCSSSLTHGGMRGGGSGGGGGFWQACLQRLPSCAPLGVFRLTSETGESERKLWFLYSISTKMPFSGNSSPSDRVTPYTCVRYNKLGQRTGPGRLYLGSKRNKDQHLKQMSVRAHKK